MRKTLTLYRTPDAAGSSSTQAALGTLETLEIKEIAPKTSYSRDQFGQAWADVDHNGCDTRNDTLRRDLISITVKPGTQGCKVITGVLDDPYTASTIDFKRGDQIPPVKYKLTMWSLLSDAWQTGAQELSAPERDDQKIIETNPYIPLYPGW